MELFTKTKRKLIITGSIVFLLIAAFSGLSYYFLSLNTEVQDLQTKIAQAKLDEQQVGAIKKALQDVEGNKALLDDLFITSDNEADFIKSIEALASSTKVALDITTLRHDPGPPKTRFEYVAMQGNIEGELSQVYHFLHMLGRFPKALEVRQIQLELLPVDGKKKERIWRGTFGVRSLKIK